MPRNRKHHYVKILSKDVLTIARIPWPFNESIVDFAQAIHHFYKGEPEIDICDAVPLPSTTWRGADVEAAWKLDAAYAGDESFAADHRLLDWTGEKLTIVREVRL